jgi:PIN domain nuclease of toxin-antitoxin system
VRFLLDTHVLVFWYADAADLDAAHRGIVTEAEAAGERLGLSSITLWEVAKFVERGRLRLARPVEEFLADVEANRSIEVLPITSRIAVESTRLGQRFPRDPADQIIAATARAHGLVLLTMDQPIRDSGVVPVG